MTGFEIVGVTIQAIIVAIVIVLELWDKRA